MINVTLTHVPHARVVMPAAYLGLPVRSAWAQYALQQAGGAIGAANGLGSPATFDLHIPTRWRR